MHTRLAKFLVMGKVATLAAAVLFMASLAVGQATGQVNLDLLMVNVSGMKSGIVTEVTGQAVVINGHAYGVVPDLEVLNQFGKSGGLDSLRKDLQVFFHLRQTDADKTEKIDKLVVVVPQ